MKATRMDPTLTLICCFLVSALAAYFGAFHGVERAMEIEDAKIQAALPKCEICGVEPIGVVQMQIGPTGSSAIKLCKKCAAEGAALNPG